MIRVFLVAASLRVRHDLESRLSESGIEVMGSAADFHLASEEFPGWEADVLVAAVHSDSVEQTLDDLEEQGIGSEVPIVLLLDQNSIPQWNRSLCVGVRGILPVGVGSPALISTLRAVANGLVVVTSQAAGQLLNGTPNRRPETVEEPVESLTPRELEVLRMMGDGLANKEIAARLRISEHTAKFHVASILGKLGASTRTEAVTLAMRMGLLML